MKKSIVAKTLAVTLTAATIMSMAVPAFAMSDEVNENPAVETTVSLPEETPETENVSAPVTEDTSAPITEDASAPAAEESVDDSVSMETEQADQSAPVSFIAQEELSEASANPSELSQNDREVEALLQTLKDISGKMKQAKANCDMVAFEQLKSDLKNTYSNLLLCHRLSDDQHSRYLEIMTEATGIANSAYGSGQASDSDSTMTLEEAIANIDGTDLATFPDGHYYVGNVEVYSDHYCTALVYHDEDNENIASCSGKLLIKDTSVWDQGELVEIAGTRLEKIIVPVGNNGSENTYGLITGIRLYKNAANGNRVVVHGGTADNYWTYQRDFTMTFMDETNTEYDLTISRTNVDEAHIVSYKSDCPNMIRIDWNGAVRKLFR